MTWQYVSVALACGCPGTGSWDATDPGDEQTCTTHGPTTVQRVSRCRETTARAGTSLGIQEG